MTLAENDYTQEFSLNGYCLDEIPDFQGLLPKSLAVGVPVFELSDQEINESGNVLQSMKTNRDKFFRQFHNISNHLIKLLSHV